MTRAADAVVVGGGIVGAAVALELARRDLAVVICEQGRAPGRGATTWSGGLVRQHHTAHCDTRLAVRGLRTFEHWADLIGGDCGYRRCGFVVVVAAHHGERLRRNVAAVNEAGGESELVDVAELAAHHPTLAFDDSEEVGLLAAHEPKGGYVDPRAATLSLVAAGIDAGAHYGEGIVVTGLTVSHDAVVGVETNVGSLSAPVVVLAAGAWSAQLAAPVGLELPLETRRIGMVHAAVDAAADQLPAGIDDTLGTYFRPGNGRRGGLYFGAVLHPAVSLDQHPAPINPNELAMARKTIGVRIPEAARAAINGTRAGFDGYTPDKHPAMGASDVDGLYLCTGFSGSGVKMAPAVAEAVAAEIVDGRDSELLAPYRPQRFTTGTFITHDEGYDYI